MTHTQAALIATIKHSLWDEPYHVCFDNLAWDDVISEAYAQTVIGLVLDGSPETIRRQYREASYQQYADFSNIIFHQSQIVSLLNKNHIPFAILKGSSAAVYYPNPKLRMLGDIDFIVPRSKVKTTYNLMLANGYKEDPNNGKKARHIGFWKEGVRLELHFHFSYDWIDIENFIVDGIKHAELKKISGFSFPSLPPLANGLVLLTHAANHIKSGLGLRQVIDWMMYVQNELDDDFWNRYFHPASEQVGLSTFAITITALCKKYLGLKKNVTWCAKADPATVEELFYSLLRSGNFGLKLKNGAKIENVLVAFSEEGILHRLQRTGEDKWKMLGRHPYLRPFAWMYQFSRYIRKGISRGFHIPGDVKHGLLRIKLLHDLDLD